MLPAHLGTQLRHGRHYRLQLVQVAASHRRAQGHYCRGRQWSRPRRRRCCRRRSRRRSPLLRSHAHFILRGISRRDLGRHCGFLRACGGVSSGRCQRRLPRGTLLFVRECYQKLILSVHKVTTEDEKADVLTKALPMGDNLYQMMRSYILNLGK